jgi:hypothetical protein
LRRHAAWWPRSSGAAPRDAPPTPTRPAGRVVSISTKGRGQLREEQRPEPTPNIAAQEHPTPPAAVRLASEQSSRTQPASHLSRSTPSPASSASSRVRPRGPRSAATPEAAAAATTTARGVPPLAGPPLLLRVALDRRRVGLVDPVLARVARGDTEVFEVDLQATSHRETDGGTKADGARHARRQRRIRARKRGRRRSRRGEGGAGYLVAARVAARRGAGRKEGSSLATHTHHVARDHVLVRVEAAVVLSPPDRRTAAADLDLLGAPRADLVEQRGERA